MRGIKKSIQYNLKQVGIKHKDNQILNILLIINIKLFIQSLYEDYAIFTMIRIYIRTFFILAPHSHRKNNNENKPTVCNNITIIIMLI